MVISLVFFLHLIFILIVFTRKWQSESLGSAFLNMALIIIIFSIGWSLFGMLVKMIVESEGFGTFYDRDTITLSLLTLSEAAFYRIFYKDL